MEHMEKTPISRLSAVGEREGLYSSTGLLLTRPQSEGEDKTPTQYVSHNMSYGNLVRTLVLDTMSANGDAIPVDRPIPSSYTTIDSVFPYRMYAMSAMSNDEAAQMDGLSVYNIRTAVESVLKDVTVPHVDATDSPWLLSADVVTTAGDSANKIASQLLVMSVSSQISSEMCENVLATEIGTSESFAASQMLATAVRDVAETSCKGLFDIDGLLPTSMVSSEPSDDDEAAASIGFVTRVHDMLSSVPTEPPKPHEDGNVWYLTPDEVGESKPLLTRQVLVVDDYSDISASIADNTDGIIVSDSSTNEASSMNGGQFTRLDSTGTQLAGLGRFVRNPYTKKVYFSDVNGFVKIYQPKSS